MLNIPPAVNNVDTVVSLSFQLGVSSNKASELAAKAIMAKTGTAMVKKTMVNIPSIKASLNA